MFEFNALSEFSIVLFIIIPKPEHSRPRPKINIPAYVVNYIPTVYNVLNCQRNWIFYEELYRTF